MVAADFLRRVPEKPPYKAHPVLTDNEVQCTLQIGAALSAPGVEAVMEWDGALNTASFALYLAQVLGPGWPPGDVVVLDNLPVKADGLAQLVEARGARLLYLPRTSRILRPLNWPSVSSKRICARLPPVPARH